MSRLSYLAVGSNKFTGSLPSFGNKLSWLVANNNSFDDLNFISTQANASNLEVLSLAYNSLRGMLPESIGNLSKLSKLYLSSNHLSGTIPESIRNLVNLQDLVLSTNTLTGNIPSHIGELQKLQRIDFSENQFTGNIPPSIGNLTLLTEVYLGTNDFNGSIPLSLGNCQLLTLLDLSQNNLSGRIPQQLLTISSFSISLNVSHNQLTGTLPTEVGKLINLGAIDVSNNMLSGDIPSTLGSCIRLEKLYMGGNFFQGTIPSSFSSLRGIQVLNFSRNNFSGTIPDYLGGFNILYLDLSFNDFEGALPRNGIFKNATAIFLKGNKQLCGGIPEILLPKCNFKRSKRNKTTTTLKLVVATALGLVGLTTLFVLLLCWIRKNRKQPISTSPVHSILRVSYQSLVKATNGFSSANFIGAGGFGSVYKGILDDGRVIAVKVLNLQQSKALKSFAAECAALRNIRHRNLLKVLTACSSVDYQGNEFKAMVYEFMINGSLEEWLHLNSVSEENEALEEKRHLNLLQRLNIAIDVATAIDYLHNHCKPHVVHCDIKPSNVLMDNELTAHVGDFGLARLFLEANNDQCPSQTSSVGVKGSIGYTPPEYGMGSQVSICGDVYSYGILLLEMFTGKKPTDDMFTDGMNLHSFARMAFPEEVMDIADQYLLKIEQGGPDCMNKQINQECLISIFKIGISCSVESPRERMDISDVIIQLHVVRDIYLETTRVQGS